MGGGLLRGGGGGKGYVGPASQIIGGPGPPWPPSSYAHEQDIKVKALRLNKYM